MFKSGNISKAVNNIKINAGTPVKTEYQKIADAVSRLDFEPDQKIKIVNEICNAENKYDKACELMGVARADKIAYALR